MKGARRALSDSVSRAVPRNVGIADAYIAERITAHFEQRAVAFLFDEKARFHDTASQMTGAANRTIAGMPIKNHTKIIGAATCQTITPDMMMTARRKKVEIRG